MVAIFAPQQSESFGLSINNRKVLAASGKFGSKAAATSLVANLGRKRALRRYRQEWVETGSGRTYEPIKKRPGRRSVRVASLFDRPQG